MTAAKGSAASASQQGRRFILKSSPKGASAVTAAPSHFTAHDPIWGHPPGVLFIAALLREHAVPRRANCYPSAQHLLDAINRRWPGILKPWDLWRAMFEAGLGIDRLTQFSTKGMKCLNFELDQPVSEWEVPALCPVEDTP